MRGERFYAEGFRSVMAGEQEIDTEFFRSDGSPMRRLAGNKRVDLFGGNSINL